MDRSNFNQTVNVQHDVQAISERLRQSLRFKTISVSGPTQTNGAEFEGFIQFLERSFPAVHAGLKRERVGEFSLLYTWEGSEKGLPILLAAHMDVVPSEADDKWSFPPFEGRLEQGFIWGRGTLDDKVSVLGILEAVEALLRQGFVPGRTIYLAFGHDEEVGGKEGATRIAALLKARNIALDYVLDEGSSIIEGVVPYVSRPVAMVGIAEKGSVFVELSVTMAGGHSSMPPQQTAIGILATAISRLEANPFPPKMESPARQLFEALAPEMPLIMRVIFSNLWLFKRLVLKKLAAKPVPNASVRTTAAPTMFNAGIKDNILATDAKAVINFRLLPGDGVDKIFAHVRKVVADPRVRIDYHRKTELVALVSDTASRGYVLLEKVIRQVFPDAVVAPGLVLSATDSKHYATLTRNIFRFLPVHLKSGDDMKRIHGVDERIAVDGYAQVVEFYTQLLLNENS